MMTKVARQLRASLAATAGLLLAGCSATHVGESWQCPLAQGSSCATIAEADPAVPAGAARPAVLFGDPLPGSRRPEEGAAAGGSCDGACGFTVWLRKLFGPGGPATVPPAASAAAASPEPAAAQDGEVPTAAPGSVVPDDASLRVPEVLGRIWIAPFVDADGIYREAHWVRVVLEPAGWRLP